MPGIDEALDAALDAEEKKEADENNPSPSSTDKEEKAETPSDDTPEEGAEGSVSEGDGTDGSPSPAAHRDEQEVLAGLELIKALKDPIERRKMIQFLATESGFDLKEAAPKEKQAFEKSITEALKEKLADEYALLPAALGDTLEEIIEAKVNARVKPIENELLAAREKAHVNSLQAELDWAYTNLNGFKTHEDAILAKMQKLYKGPDVSVRDYLKDLYDVVVPAEEKTKTSTRASSPPTDKTDRLKLQTGGTGGKSVKAPSKTPAPSNKSLDEALDLALDEMGV